MRPAIQDFGAVDAVCALAAIILAPHRAAHAVARSEKSLNKVLGMDPCSPIWQEYLMFQSSGSNDLGCEIGHNQEFVPAQHRG